MQFLSMQIDMIKKNPQKCESKISSSPVTLNTIYLVRLLDLSAQTSVLSTQQHMPAQHLSHRHHKLNMAKHRPRFFSPFSKS